MMPLRVFSGVLFSGVLLVWITNAQPAGERPASLADQLDLLNELHQAAAAAEPQEDLIDRTDWLTGQGRVLQPDGDPIAATVQLAVHLPIEGFDANDRRTIDRQTITTNDQGLFAYQAPPNCRLEFLVSVEAGRRGHGRRFNVKIDAELPTKVEIRLTPRDLPNLESDLPDLPVTIILLDEHGEPLPIQGAELILGHGDNLRQSVSNVAFEDGTAVVHLRRGGRWQDPHVRLVSLTPPGWMIEGPRAIRIDPDAEDWTQRFTVVPAGAIHGVIRDEEGVPLAGAHVTLPSLFRRTTTDRNGRFLIHPIPLNRQFQMNAYPDSPGLSRSRLEWLLGAEPTNPRLRHAIQIDDTRVLTTEERVIQADLTIPRGVDIPLRVRDADQQPVADTPITIRWRSNRSITHETWARTNDEGQVLLEGVNLEATDALTITLPSTEHRPWSRQTIPLTREGIEIEIPPACLARGQVVNDASGKPIAGIRIDATPANRARGNAPTRSVFTDDHGHFMFTNLDEREYILGVPGYARSGTVILVDANGDERLRGVGLRRFTPSPDPGIELSDLNYIPREQIPRIKQ